MVSYICAHCLAHLVIGMYGIPIPCEDHPDGMIIGIGEE